MPNNGDRCESWSPEVPNKEVPIEDDEVLLQELPRKDEEILLQEVRAEQ